MKKNYEKLKLRIVIYDKSILTDIITSSVATTNESILYFNENWLGE